MESRNQIIEEQNKRIRELIEKTFHIRTAVLAELFQAEAKIRSVPKGGIIVKEGEVSTELPVLFSGIARGFLYDMGGNEITDCFAFCPGDPLMGCNLLAETSMITVEALTEVKMFYVPMGAITQAIKHHPDIYQVLLDFYVRGFKRHWEQKIMLNRRTAHQRLLWFQEKYPGLLDVIPNIYIASFLGITPVTLSRVKNQIVKNGMNLKEEVN